ncbi:MAG: biopolymer transport protein ExbB [Flavobacteriales bacterium]|jgi:biopolymer transport protein ExbB
MTNNIISSVKSSSYRAIAISIFAGIAFSSMSFAADTKNIAKELQQKIIISQKSLSKLEEKIGGESRSLSKKLNTVQSNISSLRKKAAASQRVLDDQLLGLDQLKTRLDRWKTQSSYQKHLLHAYVESAEINLVSGKASGTDNKNGMQVIRLATNQIEAKLQTQWVKDSVVNIQGQIVQTNMLNFGPIILAYDPGKNTGGPVEIDPTGEKQILNVFNGSQLESLAKLYEGGKGDIIFDPSLGNAVELMNSDSSILSHIDKGGIWAIPIMIFGFLSILIALLKGFQFYRLPKIDSNLGDKVRNAVKTETSNPKDNASLQQLLNTTKGAQQRLISISLSTPASQRRDDLLVAYLMEHKHEITKYMGVVATSAAIAPLLGLLGTVSGMINTFKMMTIFGSGDASTVSGGISEALVTTELGLIVAIPSLLISALLTRKTKSYSHKLETFAIRLSKIRFSKPVEKQV